MFHEEVHSNFLPASWQRTSIFFRRMQGGSLTAHCVIYNVYFEDEGWAREGSQRKYSSSILYMYYDVTAGIPSTHSGAFVVYATICGCSVLLCSLVSAGT